MTVSEGVFEIEETERRTGAFKGSDPFAIASSWLEEAWKTEINDANAMQLATVDEAGLPNVRTVLLKDIEGVDERLGGFVFYTNYESAKGGELSGGKAAFVMHWKSLRRQVRARGLVEVEDGPKADEYFASRGLQSRLGAWASRQSRPLSSRTALMADVAKVAARHPLGPPRPPFWGGYRIRPVEIEFWADGAHRLHDRFVWRRESPDTRVWTVTRLNP